MKIWLAVAAAVVVLQGAELTPPKAGKPEILPLKDVKPGMHATGKTQIRRAFVAIAEYFKHSMVVTQGDMKVVESGDTALVLMQTMLHTKGDDGQPVVTERRATYVFRKGSAGQWLCVIDNSYGTDLIDAV